MEDVLAPDTPRSRMPVFVVGSPRSGTTLLYDMLLSAGGFAVYPGESNIFNLLAPRFGSLARRHNRERMWGVWLGSKLCRASGIDPRRIEAKILSDCRNAGDFLRTIMEEVARSQNALRWAGNTPEEILHIPIIKATIPDALVIHIIRDGRDVALSLAQRRFLRPFPWKDRESLFGAGLYWEWIVGKGRKYGRHLGSDYMEVRFEQLVAEPRDTLARLSSFLDHELDYDRIQQVAFGSVGTPNTSFRAELAATFDPVGRWRKRFSPDQLVGLERLIGKTLADLSYPLVTARSKTLRMSGMRHCYRVFFEAKLWSKISKLIRPVRRELTSRQVDEIVMVDEHLTASAARRLQPTA